MAAGTSQSRPWKATHTESLPYLARAGSGVWFSNDRMATVLMLGKPPPAKPKRQAASARPLALPAAAPQRRVDDRRGVHRHHRELKTGRAPPEIRAPDGRPPGQVALPPGARHDFALAAPLRPPLPIPPRAVAHPAVQEV